MQKIKRNRYNTWPRVFVAMPFGEKQVKRSADTGTDCPYTNAGEDVSVDFDEVWGKLLRPALQRARCRPYRADQEASAGDIRTDMFFELVTGEFVLADISTLNANVFYELGVRHGVSPHGVLMVDGGWDHRPFDVAPDRTFTYRGGLFELGVNRDQDSWEKDVKTEVKKLAKRLQAAIATDASTISSPVYKELVGLKPVDWGQIKNAKARYFGNQLQDWNARVRKAKRQSYTGDILTLSRDAPNRFIEWQLKLDAAQALSDLGRFERAQELLRAMVAEDPTCTETRYALAKTLDRLAGLATDSEMRRDYLGRAEIEIEEALRHGGDITIARYRLGRIYKSRWRNFWEHKDDESTRYRLAAEYWESAKKSLDYYQEAQIHNLGSFYAGLNVISLHRLREHLGLQEETGEAAINPKEMAGLVKMAAHRTLVLEQRDTTVEKDESKVIWATAAMAELAMLSARRDEARKIFQRAATHPEVSLFQLKAFDDQLHMYEKIGFENEIVVQLRKIVHGQLEAQKRMAGRDLSIMAKDESPRVFVFRGESFDDPELEKAARSRIEGLLQKQWRIREGDLVICSARRGSEIVFAEECFRLKANVRLLLPLSRAEFVSQSVRKRDTDWEQRFYKLAEKCNILEQPARLGITPVELDPYERNNVWCLETARTELGPNVRPRVIVLSIGGDDHSVSAGNSSNLRHFERCAENLGLLVERAVVWPTEEPTLILTGKTLAHVHRPGSKADSLSLEKELRVGRAGDNEIILFHPTISRHHLILKPAKGGIQLINLSGHPNMTFLDGVPLAPGTTDQPLLVKPEQTIKLVDGTEITFEVLKMPQ